MKILDKKKVILCVDDIEANLFTLKSILASVYGDKYEILTASGGNDALKLLLSKRVDMMLLDIMMPGVDGFEVAKLVKSNKLTKDISIIFLTAKRDDDTINTCFKIGGSDYIAKPFNKEELCARIDFHLLLKDNMRSIYKEQEFVKAILDFQDSLIMVIKDDRIVRTNKKFMHYFNSSDLTDIKCIAETFLEVTDYFYLDLCESENWVEYLYENRENDNVPGVISIMDRVEFIPKSFYVKIAKYDDLYIVSFLDVTLMDTKLNKYKKMATYDKLTKIYNRQTFDINFKSIINSAYKTDNVFSFSIIDIDKFKLINDNYGHLEGDRILIKLAETISKHIRTSDIFARWGGEEFVLILPQANINISKTIMENLRKYIENEFKEDKPITCSFGVTEYKRGDSAKSIIKRADEALYEAKNSGRNRVCIK